MFCSETNTEKGPDSDEFDVNGSSCLGYNEFMSLSSIQSLESLTFGVEIEMVNISYFEQNKEHKNMVHDPMRIALLMMTQRIEEIHALKAHQQPIGDEISAFNEKLKGMEQFEQSQTTQNKENEAKFNKLQIDRMNDMDTMNKKFQSLMDKLERIELRLTVSAKKQNDVIERMEEYQRKNDEEMAKMKEEMERLSLMDGYDDDEDNKEQSEEEKVRAWMEETVKLGQYAQVLIDNGFDEMESLMDITMEELEEMGVDKMGHRKKIFKNAQKMAVKATNNNNHNLSPYPQTQIAVAHSAFSQTLWICTVCNTKNIGMAASCKTCGVHKEFLLKSKDELIEGPNVMDTR